MIILGDISGIQNYLFDVADTGGGQARRLRARSFYIQLLAEAAALQVLQTLGWPSDDEHFVLSGAGKFLLRGPSSVETPEKLCALDQEFSDWLLREMRGELRMALGWADGDGSEVATYRAAMAALQQAKLRPWAPASRTIWDPGRLVLGSLDRPCGLCGHATAVGEEKDDETGDLRQVCRRCAADRNPGTLLPRAHWLLFQDTPSDGDIELFGPGARVFEAGRLGMLPGMIAVSNLTHPETPPAWCPTDRFLRRHFMAHIPVANGKPVWFVELARQAKGDHLLGVLKADADSLGIMIERLLERGSDLRSLAGFSRELDEFFASRLKQEMESGGEARWNSIYTIFSGGDDLLLVGPWDVMFDFADRVRELFQEQFGGRGLTISAAVTLIKPKRPIKTSVAEVERLLERAKTVVGPLSKSAKDSCAAFGQLWKWEHHEMLLRSAKQLTDWVERKQSQRGWLHTLLKLIETRQGDPERGVPGDSLATARLSYHVTRNYPLRSPMRRWGEQLAARFDNLDDPEIRYLPAILRYALTATRTPEQEE
jgi:CRISPR-associated protein Csm1